MKRRIIRRLKLQRETLTDLGEVAVLEQAVQGARLPHTVDRTCGTCFTCPNNPSVCFTC